MSRSNHEILPRVAVAGAGYWGKNLVRNFHSLGALGRVCDSSEETLSLISGQYQGIAVTRDYAELINDPRLDAIVLATPAESHYSMAREALLAGKDVFVEKPLSLRSVHGEELVRLARSGGRILMTGHLLHYHPAIRKISELVDSGEIGSLYYMSSNRLNLGKLRREENVLWSFAPHDVSVMLMLAGASPDSVLASGGSFIQPGIHDTTMTCLSFPGGIRGHIYVSWLHPFKDHKLVVIGSRRMLVFDDLEDGEKIRLYDKGVDSPETLQIRSNGFEVIPFVPDEPLKLECEHFLDCVRCRRQPETDGESGVRVLRVLEAAQESLDGGGKAVAMNHEVYARSI